MFCAGCYYNLEAVCQGSVHSSDSLSDSSPPAPGVPTQAVQPVQTTPQVPDEDDTLLTAAAEAKQKTCTRQTRREPPMDWNKKKRSSE
ncbi:hypothetical protein Q5P01_026285 [Channa striata]|uniref:EBP50 C-terminal domain-containing protein n=1 Tax=Channa striata TaxID=64152 RepID=A0AA88IG38_CHASR|nr:hypothetical protein Q5P01_026285 [Channa striata]